MRAEDFSRLKDTLAPTHAIDIIERITCIAKNDKALMAKIFPEQQHLEDFRLDKSFDSNFQLSNAKIFFEMFSCVSFGGFDPTSVPIVKQSLVTDESNHTTGSTDQ